MYDQRSVYGIAPQAVTFSRKQKTAYEVRISDWSSDVCSSDLGLSSKPPGGYDKKTQAGDLSAVLNHFKVKQVDLVTHDIGNMVGFEIGRASCRDRVCQYV